MARLVSNLTRIAAKCPAAASAALLQTGKDILELSQQLVPVDTSSLKKSGGVVPVDSHTVQVGYGGEGEYFAKGNEGKRQPSKYAQYVEFGTSNSAAQPYLVPAFLQNQTTFHKRMAEEMKKIEGVT